VTTPAPGLLRLILEFAFFAFAAWALFDLDSTALGWILAAAMIIHYAASYDRVRWLVGSAGRPG